MERSFNTLAELQAQIDVLKIRRFEQEEAIKNSFDGPGAIFSTVTSLFKGSGKNSEKSFVGDLMNHDFVSSISRVALPAILNMFFFRRSNFITKAIVTFLSQKAAKKVNTGLVTGIIDKVKHIFKQEKISRTANARVKDYGIPPDSETY